MSNSDHQPQPTAPAAAPAEAPIPADNLLNLGEDPAVGDTPEGGDTTTTTNVQDLPLDVLQEQQRQQPATIAEQEALATTTMVVDGLSSAPALVSAQPMAASDETDVYETVDKKRPKPDNQDDNQDNEEENLDPTTTTTTLENDDDVGPRKKKKKKTLYYSSHLGPMPSWNDMFFALMAFKSKLGTFHVPAQTKLGRWVQKQRQEYSKLQRKRISYRECSELSEERIQVLDSLGFIWDTMLHENGRRWNQVRSFSLYCILYLWSVLIIICHYLYLTTVPSKFIIIIVMTEIRRTQTVEGGTQPLQRS